VLDPYCREMGGELEKFEKDKGYEMRCNVRRHNISVTILLLF
jgi:hypothetical protein